MSSYQSSTTMWSEMNLGQVATLQRGYDLPYRLRSSGDVPVVTSTGITDTHSEAKEQAPGVVTGRYGTIGQVFYITAFPVIMRYSSSN
jgi:type I restriction enzyme, S subunit